MKNRQITFHTTIEVWLQLEDYSDVLSCEEMIDIINGLRNFNIMSMRPSNINDNIILRVRSDVDEIYELSYIISDIKDALDVAIIKRKHG